MKYRLVIFDFDGTLANTFPWFLGVINDVAEKYNFQKIDETDSHKLRMLDAAAVLKHLKVPRWKVPMISRHMRRLMSRDVGQIALFPGIREIINDLRSKNIQIGILSSNSHKNIEQILGRSILSDISYFECGASLFGKAHKIARVLSKSAVPKKEAIYVGDEVRDLRAARQIGIAFGGVAWGYNNVESLRTGCPEELFLETSDISERVIWNATEADRIFRPPTRKGRNNTAPI